MDTATAIVLVALIVVFGIPAAVLLWFKALEKWFS